MYLFYAVETSCNMAHTLVDDPGYPGYAGAWWCHPGAPLAAHGPDSRRACHLERIEEPQARAKARPLQEQQGYALR